jgi:hypothetical protein
LSAKLVALTPHALVKDPLFLEKLAARGIGKFIAFGVRLAVANQKEEVSLRWRCPRPKADE